MSKIIDFEEEQKRRAQEKLEKTEKETFFERFKQCEEKIRTVGVCDCDVCAIKAEMTDRLLLTASDMAVEYMNSTSIPLYYGDLLEVLAMATIKLKNYCQTDIEEPEDKNDEDDTTDDDK